MDKDDKSKIEAMKTCIVIIEGRQDDVDRKIKTLQSDAIGVDTMAKKSKIRIEEVMGSFLNFKNWHQDVERTKEAIRQSRRKDYIAILQTIITAASVGALIVALLKLKG